MADDATTTTTTTAATAETHNPVAVPDAAPDAAPAAAHEDATHANGSTTASATIQNAKDTVLNTAQSAIDAIQNNPTVQSLSNGPVATNVKDEASKASVELQNLANARSAPAQPAATGQPLTNYHSMFYTLLSWENPRATGIAFAGAVIFIFLARYLNILRYIFKFAYFVLGVTASLEIAGKFLFNSGFASQMRPRKYWTIPKESLERSLDDVEQLLNFFVIESQRILYAENVYATITVFAAAFISYWLIKIVPFWGLSLIATCVLFLTPLVYIKNRDTIDSSMQNVTEMISSQTSQLRDITVQQASRATESVKTYAGEYTSKAQEYMGSRRSSEQTTTPKVNEPHSSDSEPVVKQEASTPVPEVKVEPQT